MDLTLVDVKEGSFRFSTSAFNAIAAKGVQSDLGILQNQIPH